MTGKDLTEVFNHLKNKINLKTFRLRDSYCTHRKVLLHAYKKVSKLSSTVHGKCSRMEGSLASSAEKANVSRRTIKLCLSDKQSVAIVLNMGNDRLLDMFLYDGLRTLANMGG